MFKQRKMLAMLFLLFIILASMMFSMFSFKVIENMEPGEEPAPEGAPEEAPEEAPEQAPEQAPEGAPEGAPDTGDEEDGEEDGDEDGDGPSMESFTTRLTPSKFTPTSTKLTPLEKPRQTKSKTNKVCDRVFEFSNSQPFQLQGP